MSAIIAEIQPKGFDQLIKDTQTASKSMTDLDTTLQKAQKTLDGLDKNSQAFKDLTKEVQAATLASETYSKSNESLKREYRATVDEVGKLQRALVELDKAGLKNSQTYKDIAKEQENLKKKSGQLKDEIGDLNKEIATSGSDTKNLDKTLRAVNTVAAGYQAAQGALVLFGGENKKFEETLLKLNAVMAVTQGLQQIQEELSKKDSIFTMAAAKAKALYAAATEGATVAVSALRVAFISLGIGALIVAVGYLVANWDKLKLSIASVTDKLKDLAKQREKDSELADKQIADLQTELEYRIAIGDLDKKGALEESIKKQTEAQKKKLDSYKAEQKVLTELEKSYKGAKEAFGIREGATKEQVDAQAEKVRKADIAFKKYTLSIKATKDELDKLNNPKDKKEDSSSAKKIKAEKDFTSEFSRENEKRYSELEERQKKNLRSFLEIQKKKADALRESFSLQNQIIVDALKEQLKDNTANEKLRKKTESDRIIDLNREKQEAYLDDENRQRQNLQNSFSIANELGRGLFSISKSISDTKLAILDDELNRGVISNKKYQAEVRKIKRQEAIAAKAEAAFNIGLSIAEGIAKALTKGPLIGQILGGLTAAIGAAQLAIVLSKPIPQFRHGGMVKEHGLLKGRSHEQGGTIVEAEMDEYFMPTKQTKKYLTHLEAMRKGNYDDFIQKEQFGYLKQSLFKNHFRSIPRTDMIPKFESKDRSADNLEKLLDEVWQMKHAIKNMDRNNVGLFEENNNIIKSNKGNRYV